MKKKCAKSKKLSSSCLLYLLLFCYNTRSLIEQKHKGFSKRSFLKYTAGAAGLFGLSYLLPKTPYQLEGTPVQRPEVLGTSFSQVQCRHLKMSEVEMRNTYLKVLDMGFDIVRIGAYMDEIDERGFEFLDWQIEEAEKRKVNLIVNVGIKVQRYPEYHPTRSIRERLKFWEKPNQVIGSDPQTFEEVVENTRKVVQRYKNRKIIKYWQGENEALDKLEFANGHVIAEDLLDAENDVIREEKNPDQKLILSSAINLPDSENNFLRILKRRPDGAGFNVYYRIPKNQGGYYELSAVEFEDLQAKAEIIKQTGAEPIIYESQAEPWENGAPVHIDQQDYPSSNPELAIKLASKLSSIGYKTVLLWGCEYWIYHANRGNTKWVDKMKEYIQSKQAA